MQNKFALFGALLCLISLTASAQFPNWGPYSPAATASGDPAALCAHYTGNVCIIAELCTYYKGNCTPAGPGGGSQDSGGVGKWQITMTTSGGYQVNYTTNSSNNSQGYIVVIGGPYVSYSFAGAIPGPYWNGTMYCIWYGGATQFQAVQTFGGSKYYYRNLSLCE